MCISTSSGKRTIALLRIKVVISGFSGVLFPDCNPGYTCNKAVYSRSQALDPQ